MFLEEELTECSMSEDVCFGKVVLFVSNTSSTSEGVLEVEKGCGIKTSFEELYKTKASFNSARKCFTTTIEKSNRVLNNIISSNGSILSSNVDSDTSTSRQEELCICEGSKCNQGQRLHSNLKMLYSLFLLVGFKLTHQRII